MMGFSSLVLTFVLITLDPTFPNRIRQIVDFNNKTCDAIDGTIGTCYRPDLDCTEMGGKKRGKCASGVGFCCVGKNFALDLLTVR